MNKPRILLPLAVAGLALAAAFATAALVTAAEDQPKADLQEAEVDALFDIAPMSDAMRAKLVKADEEAALQQAEVDAMFAVAPMVVRKQTGPAKDLQSERGREVYLGLCFACHLPDGKGIANVFPPLAGSDYLVADRDRAVRIVLKGLTGPVTVNGVTYNSAMPPLETTLAEHQIADVLTYVTGEWGNKGSPYSVDDVKRVIREHAGLLPHSPKLHPRKGLLPVPGAAISDRQPPGSAHSPQPPGSIMPVP